MISMPKIPCIHSVLMRFWPTLSNLVDSGAPFPPYKPTRAIIAKLFVQVYPDKHQLIQTLCVCVCVCDLHCLQSSFSSPHL